VNENESPLRPNGLLSVVLRLGCALLACAGIAAARGSLGPVDEAAARLRAQEQQVGPILESSQDAVVVQESSEKTAIRRVRRARPQARRSVPVAAVPGRPAASRPSLRALQLFAVRRRASGVLPTSVSPRGPPASA
jgi:hypothetical protein